MIKLIAIDIDGTLINSKGEITERTKKALIEAQRQGHKVVLSSGRSPKGVIEYAKELEMDKFESYISNYNGSVVTDMKTMEKTIDHKLSIEDTRKILQFSETIDIDYLIYYNDKIYVNSMDTYKLDDVIKKNHDMEVVVIEDLSSSIDFEPNNILFAQDPLKIKEPADSIKEKFGNDFSTMYSEPYYFELMPKDVTKGDTLLEIASYLGIKKEDIYAFGDSYNDLSMIELAGNGVAMGNGVSEIKEAADFVTLSNEEDGIGVFVEEHILNK